MQPSPTSVSLETYNTLYERSKQSYDAALHWHKAYEELMAEMKREVATRDRHIDNLRAELKASMTASEQMNAKLTDLTASLKTMKEEKKTWVAQTQASQRAAQSAEEKRHKSEEDRRMGLLLRFAIDASFKPLEARLSSLSQACRLVTASDEARQQTKQTLEQLRADFTALSRSLAPLMTAQQRQQLVGQRLSDNQRALTSLIASMPSKPPICPDCLSPVDDPQQKLVINACGHEHHEACVQRYLALKLRTSTAYPLRCPGSIDPSDGDTHIPCQELIDYTLVERSTVEDRDRLVRIFNKWQLPTMSATWVECPLCQGLLLGDGNRLTRVPCPYCQKEFCTNCHVAWHANQKCEEFKAAQDEKSPAHQAFLALAQKQGLVRCKCKSWFEKDKGCNHMKCPFCENEWCHVCKRELKKGEWSKHYEGKGACVFATEAELIYS